MIGKWECCSPLTLNDTYFQTISPLWSGSEGCFSLSLCLSLSVSYSNVICLHALFLSLFLTCIAPLGHSSSFPEGVVSWLTIFGNLSIFMNTSQVLVFQFLHYLMSSDVLLHFHRHTLSYSLYSHIIEHILLIHGYLFILYFL